MGLIQKDDGWRMPDWLWKRIQKHLPLPKWHPLGCYRHGNDPRAVMDAILLVMRTGMQWNALKVTKLCSSSAAHRRFQEWVVAGVFLKLWQEWLLEYDQIKKIDWSWLSMDGAMTKAPLGGGKNRGKPHRPRQRRGEEEFAGGSQGHSSGTAGSRSQSPRREINQSDDRIDRGKTSKVDRRKTAGNVFGQRLRLGRSPWASR